MGLSQAEGCSADLQATRSGNIRFARNAVSTSGVTDDATLTVQSRYGRKTGTAQVNQFDDESLAPHGAPRRGAGAARAARTRRWCRCSSRSATPRFPPGSWTPPRR